MLIIYKKDLETLCEFLIIKSIIPQVAKKTKLPDNIEDRGTNLMYR